MEAKTSSQAYEEYQKLMRLEEKLEKENRGMNLLNPSKFKEKFFISIKKIGKRTLIDSRDWLVVNSNLPFADSWRYKYGEVGVKEFLEQLERWVLIPRFSFFLCHNRKRDNQVSFWELPSFRKRNIEISEIEFRIGKEAQQEINLLGYDFIAEVKKLLSQQREATEKEAGDFEKYKLLLEELDNLKRQLPTSTYCSYGQKRDDTFKITIDKKIYNEKLKKVDVEFNKLCKKYSFLQMPTINYKEIFKELSYEDWKANGNENEAEDEWSNFDDEDKEEHEGDFENFLKWCYEEYLENNEFDE